MSALGRCGGSSELFSGRKDSSLWTMRMASASSSARKCTLPETEACMSAPPTSSMRHRLAGHRLDDLGTGDEHVGVVPGHDDEVHQRRRIGGAARAGAADDRDLRHHAGQQHVLVEHAAVSRERVDALLDAGAGGILECDDRRAEFRRLLHHRHDLLGVHLAQRAAEHGEILGEGRNHASPDIAGADDHAVGGKNSWSPCRNGGPE